MTDSNKPSAPLINQIDDIIYRCFAQGQYWGTGSGEDGKLDPDYLPEEPIDRTEAVQSILTAFSQAIDDSTETWKHGDAPVVYVETLKAKLKKEGV